MMVSQRSGVLRRILSSRVARSLVAGTLLVHAACFDKPFVAAPAGQANLAVAVALGELAQDGVTGVRIEVAYSGNGRSGVLYDNVLPFTLDAPSRDFALQLDIGPCLRDLAPTGSVLADSCPLQVVVEILSGSRVLARDNLPPMSIGAGQTVTSAALGARTATSLRLTQNSAAVPSTLPLFIGEAAQITAEVLDAAGAPIAGRAVEWSSSASNIAAVSNSGVVTAVSAGTATITAVTGSNAARLTQTFTVQASARAATQLTLSPNPGTVTVGNTLPITAVARDNQNTIVPTPPLTWESSATSIATVSSAGVVSGVAPGSVTITARTSTGVTGTTAIQVTQRPAASLSISPSTVSLVVGGTQQLAVTARDDLGGIVATPPLTWETNASTVASVSQQGLVTAVGSGSATITARSGALFASIGVTVAQSGSISGQVRNATTNLPLAGATVRVFTAANPTGVLAGTGTDGRFTVNNVSGGTYNVEVALSGYRAQIAQGVVVTNTGVGRNVRLDFDLPPSTSPQRFGGIAGRVLRQDGTPVPNADVTLSGGAQTNGVFRATRTDNDGNFTFPGVVLNDVEEQPIITFFVAASASGLAASALSINIPDNRVVANFDVVMTPAGAINTFFSDGFETASGWTTTGFWNRSTLTGIVNQAAPTYVSLAPDDNSNRALPAPATGSFAFWYGNPAQGNYMGPQQQGDSPLSGGTSLSPNFGLLTSPVFTIPANAPRATLRFDTWFEIESVNPNESGFDIMYVFLCPATCDEESETLIGTVNPFSDPTVSPREFIPFTSAGFNRAPIWRPVEFNLNAYRGQTVRLRFSFNTVDNLYNGFRGWIIDNVSVSDRPTTSASTLDAQPARLLTPSSLRRTDARRRR